MRTAAAELILNSVNLAPFSPQIYDTIRHPADRSFYVHIWSLMPGKIQTMSIVFIRYSENNVLFLDAYTATR